MADSQIFNYAVVRDESEDGIWLVVNDFGAVGY
jgi:hypothetical protein